MNKLVLKYLINKKKRTIMSIIGIALSIILVVGIGGTALSFLKNVYEESEKINGSWHYEIYPISYEDKLLARERLKSNENCKVASMASFIISIGDTQVASRDVLEENQGEGFSMTSVSKDIVEGRLPQNSNEIILSDECKKITVQDASIQVGKQIDVTSFSYEDETAVQQKSVTIVGFYNGYSAGAYTCNWDLPSSTYATYLQFNSNVKDFQKELDQMLSDANIEEQKINIMKNEILLTQLNQGSEAHKTNGHLKISFVAVALFILILMGLVIKNSISISVSEKVEQFGMLRCMGATKKQIRKMVLKESVIMWFVAWVFGCLLSFAAIKVLLDFISSLNIGLDLKFVLPLEVCLVSGVLSLIVILGCCSFPAFRAGKVSPVDAIRGTLFLTSGNSFRTKKGKLLKSAFGAPGFFASKNVRRNKKRFRSTIASITTAVIMFIIFSSVIMAINSSFKALFGDFSSDFVFKTYNSDPTQNFCNTVNSVEGVDKTALTKEYEIPFSTIQDDEQSAVIKLVSISKEVYNKYISVDGYKPSYEDLVSQKSGVIYKGLTYKDEDQDQISQVVLDIKINDTVDFQYTKNDPVLKVKILGELKERPWMYDNTKNRLVPFVFVPDEVMPQVESTIYNSVISVHCKTGYQKQLSDFFSKEVEENPLYDKFYFDDMYETARFFVNIITMIKTFIIIFMTLIILICIVNLINTILANLQSRKSEIAMLRAVGMRKKQLLKMLLLECSLYGIISTVIGSIISFILEYSFFAYAFKLFSVKINIGEFLLLTGITFVGTVLICLITGSGSIKKIVRTSIVDGIRSKD